jgi:RNA polymerase sigma-70 factor (ECF subfamily)
MLLAALLPDHEGRRLLRRVAQGDERALKALYDQHAGRIFAAASRLLGNVGEAEEIVQETFFEVWRRAETFDAERGSPTSWILSIGRNRAIDRLRARATRSRALDEVRRAPAPAGTTPERDVEAQQTRQRIAAALDLLSPEQRMVVELAYFDGLSQSEIAARTGHPLGTIKGRARAALEKLAEHLGKGAA